MIYSCVCSLEKRWQYTFGFHRRTCWCINVIRNVYFLVKIWNKLTIGKYWWDRRDVLISEKILQYSPISFWYSIRIFKFVCHFQKMILFSFKNFPSAFVRFFRYFIMLVFFLTIFVKKFCQSRSFFFFDLLKLSFRFDLPKIIYRVKDSVDSFLKVKPKY